MAAGVVLRKGEVQALSHFPKGVKPYPRVRHTARAFQVTEMCHSQGYQKTEIEAEAGAAEVASAQGRRQGIPGIKDKSPTAPDIQLFSGSSSVGVPVLAIGLQTQWHNKI